MKSKGYLSYLWSGFLAGIFLLAAYQPALAIKNVSQVVAKSPSAQLTYQLEELEQLLLTLQDRLEQKLSIAGSQSELANQQAGFQDIQQEAAAYFKQMEVLLGRHFSGSELEEVLSRQQQAKQEIERHFARLELGLKSLAQEAAQANPRQVAANLTALLEQVQGFLGLKHQPLDPEQLPTATLALPKPTSAGKYFTKLPPQPQAADLALTPETALSPSIKDLIEQLHGDPLQLYQWVCTNIDYRLGYGSLQGADLTLQTKQGNAWDQASLLIALLRISGVPARYAYGQVRPSPEQLLGWLGVDDKQAAYQLLDQAGIPREEERLVHIWVKAYLSEENRWVDLDPSFKQFPGKALGVEFQDEAWLKDLLEFALPSESSKLSILPPQPIEGQAVSRMVPPAKQELASGTARLDAGLPFKNVVCWGETSRLAPELSWKLELALAGRVHSFTLQEIACQPLSIIYLPAQEIDSELIALFNEDSGVLPAYLIKLQTYLLLDNELIALGEAVRMGTPQPLAITWQLPGGGRQQAQHLLLAGMNAVWAGNWGQFPSGELPKTKAASGVKGKFQAYLAKSIRKELNLAPLAQVALSYQQQNQRLGKLLGRYTSFYFAPGLSESLVALSPQVGFAFDVALALSSHGLQIDVQKDNFFLVPQKVNSRNKQFLAIKGALASALEHKVLEEVKQSPWGPAKAVSAIKVLSLAIEEGIPVHTLEQANFTALASQLQLPPAVRRDLQGAVKAGKTVILPQYPLQLDGGEEIGYIVMDRVTGSNAYLLRGGLGGGTSFGGQARSNINIPYPHSTIGKLVMVVLILGVLLLIAL